MSLSEKVDVLDFIIDTLTEHEKTIDDILNRLEALSRGTEFTAQVVKHGPSLSVTIPSKTARRRGFKVGDTVQVNLRR